MNCLGVKSQGTRPVQPVDRQPATRPIDGAIATDGTAVLISGTTSAEVGGTLEIQGRGGFERCFDSTVGRPAVSPDGALVGVATRPPDSTLLLIDSTTGVEIGSWRVAGQTPRVLGFYGPYLYVGIRAGDEPYLAVDADGEVAWGSDRYWATRPLSDRLESLRSTFRP